MEEMIRIFLSAIRKRSHVLKLIETSEYLKIKLECEDQEGFLVFHRGEVFSLVDNNDSTVTCEINGQRDSVNSLLEGNGKLRILINQGQLKVKAPFRTILLIESIFYLTKPEDTYKKFIS
ncbi:hypothetical protein QFZ28_001362 [Neobacillus niacini]|jgi:hypothetical protein|uniref:hypothetical protein n=1 Tax=Neobacillus niacini TaxID=86668 RepID=UPI0027815AE3|nr:hypothetical protein [Neobacillus niacini]MDQ1000962.1 hypothetical protein [Neobacillus niacini]